MTVRYTYLREKPVAGHRRGRPFGAIAFEVERTEYGAVVRFALSSANPVDPFDKSVGREMAADRMTATGKGDGKYNATIHLGKGLEPQNTTQTLNLIYSYIAELSNGWVPDRVRKCALRWLASPARFSQPVEIFYR